MDRGKNETARCVGRYLKNSESATKLKFSENLNVNLKDSSWPQLPGSVQGNAESPQDKTARTFSNIVRQPEARAASCKAEEKDEGPVAGEKNENGKLEEHNMKHTSERRTNRREKKKIEKEEKKRAREEEKRRSLVAPKGKKVQIVNQKMLETLLNNSVKFVSHHLPAPVLSDTDFPTVDESRKKRVQFMESKVELCTTSLPESRIRKRKDPIQVDLLKLIKKKHKQLPGETGRVQKRNTVPLRYSGNPLDSSNPQRKRGKIREIPKKKKPTPLKCAILEERALRCRMRTITSMMQQFSLEAVRPPNHSRKFREYCDNCVTARLNSAVKLLLKDLVRFQDRQHQRDPVKAFAKRRYVSGFREVKKQLQLKRVKMILIAPDLEVSKNPGGIDETVTALKSAAAEQEVTLMFALSRRELGYLTFKKVGISCIGILNYEGSEANHKEAVAALAEARDMYQQTCSSETEATADVNSQVVASLLSKLSETSSPFLNAIEQKTEAGEEKKKEEA